AATVAANGVDFFEPWNPALPEEPHVMAFPCMSVIVMSVLLNVAVMCAIPSASTTFFARFAPAAFAWAIYFFRRGFFLPAIPRVGVDTRLREDFLRVVGADAVNVREGVLDFLVARQIHARNACHALPLPLLVLGAALADHADHAPPLDHPAMLTDRFDAGSNLQAARSGEKNSSSISNYRRGRKFAQGAGLRRIPQLGQQPLRPRLSKPQVDGLASLVARPGHDVASLQLDIAVPRLDLTHRPDRECPLYRALQVAPQQLGRLRALERRRRIRSGNLEHHPRTLPDNRLHVVGEPRPPHLVRRPRQRLLR